jgi:hypothetical protein
MVDVNIPEGTEERFIDQFLKYLALLIEGGLAKECPVDNGYLRNSIKAEIVDGKIAISMADYGIFVEYGTAPHVIEAKPGNTLHWKANGKDMFAKKVNHPGTMANPFIRRTFFSKFKSFVEQAALAAERGVQT